MVFCNKKHIYYVYFLYIIKITVIMNIYRVKENPLITKLEENTTQLATKLVGYKGKDTEDKRVKLYSDFSIQHYYVFEEKDILDCKYLDKNHGLIEVYLKESAEVKKVFKVKIQENEQEGLYGNNSILSKENEEKVAINIPYKPLNNPQDCIDHCLNVLENTEGFLVDNPNDNNKQQSKKIVSPAGRRFLWNCLRECLPYFTAYYVYSAILTSKNKRVPYVATRDETSEFWSS